MPPNFWQALKTGFVPRINDGGKGKSLQLRVKNSLYKKVN
jgi:hypothetical protein